MGLPLLYPLVNGVRHSWASVEVKLGNFIFYVVGINYSRERERTMVMVNHPDPVGKTRGRNKYEGDCEMLLAEFNLFQTQLVLLSAVGLSGGYGDVPFDVVISYTENGLDTVTDVLKGCTLDSTSAANAESNEPTKRKFKLNPLKILIGGVDDLGTLPLVAPPGV